MAKKKSGKRRKQRRSKLPFLLLVALVIGAGGYYWYDSREPASIVPDPDSSMVGVPDDTAVESTGQSSTGSTNGTVAPPVAIDDDPFGDDKLDQVVDDWTAVEAPVVPERSAEVRAEWVANSRIQDNLPDGTYWGFLHSVIDEEERGINFDVVQYDGGFIRSSDGDQLYPAFVEDLLYASVITGDAEPGEVKNAYVSPTTLWSVANGDPAPEGIEVRGWYLLTVIDGKVVAAEGVVTP